MYGSGRSAAAEGREAPVPAYLGGDTQDGRRPLLNLPSNLLICEMLLVPTTEGDAGHMWDSALPFTMSHIDMSPPDFRTTWRKFLRGRNLKEYLQGADSGHRTSNSCGHARTG